MPRRTASRQHKHAPEEGIVAPEVPERVSVLRDGHRILVRPLLPSDREQLATRYEQLSPAARRARFGSPPDHLSEAFLDDLLDLDFDDRLALAAFALDEPGEPGVGVARYARRRDDPTEAEAAVVVLDAYQDRGIGTILLWELVDVARAHGITTLRGTVTWENADLLDSLRKRGAVVEPDEPGVASVRFPISHAEDDAPGPKATRRKRRPQRVEG